MFGREEVRMFDDMYNSPSFVTAGLFDNLMKNKKKLKKLDKQSDIKKKHTKNLIKDTANGTIASIGGRRKELHNAIKNSVKPSYDDLNEYHKLTNQIEEEVLKITNKFDEDMKSV